MTQGSKPAAGILADLYRLMAETPPAPLLASCRLFPADKAHKFTHNKREYVVAHPDFWTNIPIRRETGPQPLWDIEIVDIDLSANAMVRGEVLAAYAAVVSGAKDCD